MMVVDASVWIAAHMPHEVRFASSRRWLRRTIQQGIPLIAPIILPIEVGAAIARPAAAWPAQRRQRTQQRAQRVMRVLLHLPLLELYVIDAQLGLRAARLAVSLHLRGADAVYAALAQMLRAPLISWDNDHLHRASQRITVYTPDTAP